MEKLSNSKFTALTAEQMSSIEGGGWRLDQVDYFWDPYQQRWKTDVIMQRYNIWGNPTGEYQASSDVSAA